MPRTRTTPESTKTIHFDTVDYFAVQLNYDDGMQVTPANTVFQYGISNRDASGNKIDKGEVRQIPWGDIPANLQDDLKNIYNKILADAENEGLIGAGTDSGDLP